MYEYILQHAHDMHVCSFVRAHFECAVKALFAVASTNIGDSSDALTGRVYTGACSQPAPDGRCGTTSCCQSNDSPPSRTVNNIHGDVTHTYLACRMYMYNVRLHELIERPLHLPQYPMLRQLPQYPRCTVLIEHPSRPPQCSVSASRGAGRERRRRPPAAPGTS